MFHTISFQTVCKITEIKKYFIVHNERNKKYNCSGPPEFKNQRVGDISLTKNCCITINIKIISSIHKFIFKIQVLGSHELKSHCHLWQSTLKKDWINFQPSSTCTSMQKIRLYILESNIQTGHTHFWPCPPNKFFISFQLLWICINMPKISLFHLFILQIESILESHLMTGHIHFWPCQPLNFQHPFNFYEFVPACKKSVHSWDTVNLRVQRPDLLNLLWRNTSFRNYAIWLAESILAYISGTRFFPNIGFVQEHSK